MPYADSQARKLSTRDRSRRYRARKRAEREGLAAATPSVVILDDPVAELATWSRERLKVPPGHPLAGQPMELPEYAVSWLRAGWNSPESALCMARKNAKSAIAAVLMLGHLVGPLRRPGWRAAVASLSIAKADELRRQVEDIAAASQLDGLTFRRSPYPGMVESATGRLEVLSSVRTAGHASGFDLVLCDESGLFPLRAR